ncbi:hypothetical protein [Rathayibacter rathayi]|nr:hypothetical protein [Rathayibacter rathayi]SOE04292.1 hypothetical protein SAMN06295924_103344 [Rathayibacter rathayi NCPPB 2980 = VKM Ac-1601]
MARGVDGERVQLVQLVQAASHSKNCGRARATLFTKGMRPR